MCPNMSAQRPSSSRIPARARFTGEGEKFLECGNALAFAYGLAILVRFLVLAAQFEGFVDPIGGEAHSPRGI